MTATTSTPDSKKSFFKDYLIYNIKENRIILLASSFCAVFATIIAAIFISLLYSDTFNSINSNKTVFTFFTMMNCGFFGLICFSVAGGVTSFHHLTSKKKTDILTSLPLTHSERFWGDFLTGFITAVAPAIILALISIEIGAIMNKTAFRTFDITAMMMTTLIFALIFNYLLSVLAASICGNMVSGVIVSIIINLAVSLMPVYWIQFFSSFLAGFSETISTLETLVIPFIASWFSMTSYIGCDTEGMTDYLDIKDYFILDKPVMVCLYLVLFAAILTASYFLAKHRKAENNGKAFAMKHSAVCVITLAAFAVSAFTCWLFSVYVRYMWVSPVVIFATFALVCTAAEFISRQGVKKLGKRIMVYCVSAAALTGIVIIANATHGFGLSTNIPATDKIASVEFKSKVSGLVFTTSDKDDIKQIRTKHSEALAEYIDNLTDQDMYVTFCNTQITYTLENGKKITRNYEPHPVSLDEDVSVYEKCAEMLNSIPCNAKSYPEQYSQYAADIIKNTDGIRIHLKGMPLSGMVKPEKKEEFAKIYSADVLSSYTPDKLPIGELLVPQSQNTIWFDIHESYTNTIAFLRNPDNIQFNNDTENMYVIHYFNSNNDKSENSYTKLTLSISAEEMNSPYVKELEKLMLEVNPKDYDAYPDFDDKGGIIICNKNDYFDYYILPENFDKAKELIVKIISERAPESVTAE